MYPHRTTELLVTWVRIRGEVYRGSCLEPEKRALDRLVRDGRLVFDELNLTYKVAVN